MWNNLRARHYSVLILLAIVLLETSAIAIDKIVSRKSEAAFEIDCSFKNNAYIGDDVAFVAEDDEEGTYADAEETDEVYTADDEKVELVADSNLVSHTEEVEPIVVAAAPSFPEKYIEYSVCAGDSLSDIATRFGSETDTLKHMNNFNEKHVIKVGETIKIPMPTSNIQYVVKRGDSISKIASRFKVSQEEIIKVNNLRNSNLKIEQKLTIPLIIGSATTDSNIVTSEMANFNKTAASNMRMSFAPATRNEIKALDNITKSEIESLNISAPQIRTANVEDSNTVNITSSGKSEVIPDKEFNYTIAQGDSLLKIANRYNTTVTQIQYDNNMSGTLVKVGQVIKINPNKKMYRIISSNKKNTSNSVSLVSHSVKKGESLSTIAKKYNTSVENIVAQNNMQNTSVMIGQKIKVPVKSYKVAATAVTHKNWKKPTRGCISSPYGWRKHPVYKSRKFHSGIDLAAPKGTPIIAATGGKVIYVGRRAGYGNLIIVAHEDGYSTRYAHCSSILAQKGQQVKAGQIIARVGATGVATGNHLHFEVRKNGKTKNPLGYVNVK